uniref:Uncharacterized protein n=1 Tax=Arundo donax TaxID=35708 RepID=A0A0A8YK17_ARUDO
MLMLIALCCLQAETTMRFPSIIKTAMRGSDIESSGESRERRGQQRVSHDEAEEVRRELLPRRPQRLRHRHQLQLVAPGGETWSGGKAAAAGGGVGSRVVVRIGSTRTVVW